LLIGRMEKSSAVLSGLDTQIFPVFAFERDFRYDHVDHFFANNVWIPLVIIPIYIGFVFLGRARMEKRSAFGLRAPLVAWNLFLTLLSVAMALRIVPDLITRLRRFGFRFTVCDHQYSDGPTGFWVFVFVASKAPELVDTIFLILRKKPVILLHWYHHWTVLLYTWHGFGNRVPIGLWFAAMNCVVHSFMYFYYFLTSLGYHPSWNVILTLGQIIQMVMGTFITVYDAFFSHCSNEVDTWGGLIMYFSYFLLFTHLFWQMYCTGKPRKGKKSATAAQPLVSVSERASDAANLVHAVLSEEYEANAGNSHTKSH